LQIKQDCNKYQLLVSIIYNIFLINNKQLKITNSIYCFLVIVYKLKLSFKNNWFFQKLKSTQLYIVNNNLIAFVCAFVL